MDVRQEQPRLFKLLSLVGLVGDLLDALKLVAGLGRLLEKQKA